LWIYQEIITKLRPDLIIETGTHLGGSALFMAHLLDQLDHGELITIDIKKRECPQHERITYLQASSVSELATKNVQKRARGLARIMVVLDSAHNRSHVKQELHLYAKLVRPVGSYLIVEDTNHSLVRQPSSENNPATAVANFLNTTTDFLPDKSCEKHYLTFNPGGYLKRIK